MSVTRSTYMGLTASSGPSIAHFSANFSYAQRLASGSPSQSCFFVSFQVASRLASSPSASSLRSPTDLRMAASFSIAQTRIGEKPWLTHIGRRTDLPFFA